MTSRQQRLKKFSRDPNYVSRFGRRQITERALQIIATVERYRLIPSSLLRRLVGADSRTTDDHLQHLYHRGLVNRFCFFGPTGRPLEFNYFLDNPDALNLLIDHGIGDPDTLDFDKVKRNREKWTKMLESEAGIGRQEPSATEESQEEPSEGQRLFLKHELMISRFHGMLELAARASEDRVKLLSWHQGPILHRYIEAPKIVFRDGEWHKQEGDERIPHRPDALFTLHIATNEEPRHFFYEADRKTTNTTRMIKKLRGHFHYIAKARQHQQDYGIKRIRAVLTETLDTKWAETLRIAAQHPVVSGPKPSELFWFTASEFFTKQIKKPPSADKRPRQSHDYLDNPDVIFRPLWFTPVDAAGAAPRSLLD
jgi:protein involved in plasmid replication-relaxation